MNYVQKVEQNKTKINQYCNYNNILNYYNWAIVCPDRAWNCWN